MEELELSAENIVDVKDMDTFLSSASDDIEVNTDKEIKEKDTQEPKEDPDETITTEDDLNTKDPESVGSAEKEVGENTESNKPQVSSSKNNFYSSIAKALKDEGILSDLSDDEIKAIQKPEEFSEAMEKIIQNKLDARQKRIDQALNSGVEPSEIQKYESTIQYLSSVNDDSIEDETDDGEKLRKSLIYNDYITRGYSEQRAIREVQKSFDAGSDIEDAKEALQSAKDFYINSYNKLIEDAKQQETSYKKELSERAQKLQKSMLEDKEILGDLEVTKPIRQKAFDAISKPIYKDPNTGQALTAIQKYEMENRDDFLKNLGLIFTLTNGFKDFDGLLKSKVRKEVKKGVRELENVLNTSSFNSDGNLQFVSGTDPDPDSSFRGWKLDI